MKNLVMRDLYAVAVAFPAPHCVNGSAGIWHRAGLESHSRRPKNSPTTKTDPVEIALILELCSLRNMGAKRIQSELKRLHFISLAMAIIHKVLCQNQVGPVVKFLRKLISFATHFLFPQPRPDGHM
ncbi:transposase IS481 family [Serratia symbiotica]|uniref:Transposase IS481 family n=1 Tax=Serratia symbiotica TaxID=138074 RepID=A0A455VHY1_9GAMM|nr:transposase IS481 family [Serratia symbiotica]